ncbi:flavin reductase family protein [Nocardia sp. alder85J]|uniref:flavin reductase family protein n=1 Tax=Nocardia sp. alder85J TaxID=2862949 RepID=UPI001CD4B1ED|nr:flavin reductase family protein [Nocardia sp. alder85J]MCX4099052.1 flavin reductase family protein [Nocardia sp. alder85J]
MPSSAPDTDSAFDRVIAGADAPMWIVTTVADGNRAGCLVGFGTQASIEPRRFLACLSKENHTYRVALRAGHLAVHLLGTDAVALAQLFGAETGSEMDKFEHCEWREGPHGLPILATATGWFTGEILRRDDFGDHVGFLLRPTAAQEPAADAPALRLRAVAELTAGHRP